MEKHNKTSDFILLGFTDGPYNHRALFLFILVIYTHTWLGNVLLLSAIRLSQRLHKPMYFFLGNLSFLDICFSTVIVPKLLSTVLHGVTFISFFGCFLQLYFFVSLGVTEILLLAVMALDRYLAICNPLHYTSVMNKTVCITLVIGCWVTAALHSFLHSYMALFCLNYCEDRLIHHFFCDMTSLLKLACSSTTANELLIFTEGSMAIIIPFLLVLVSYILIAHAIFKLKTSTNRSKAFSSCSSHLTVICLFYGTIIFMYFRPPSSYSPSYDRIVSLAYTVITPMLNPYIYSLRNKDVKKSLKKSVMQLSSCYKIKESF
ncbi:olfactory receptor 1361-like [Bombina bombina]|uniref:olfactory receptor 1361-like n=1 Tax=Bombina bombina TaxID=8345 RepID=UPI00235AA43C|nr:olfactory receptor 1361-like [Bombina bombina]